MAPSGSGKTTSLRNLDPEKSVIVQVVNKRLPFPEGKNWKTWDKNSATGSRIALTNPDTICKFITKAVESGKKIIIIDDFVYLMANKVMEDIETAGFEIKAPLVA